MIGETLPKVDLSDISGKPVDFDESEYTVICFWNRHCSICIRELIVLNILAEDYPNVQFVGLTPDSPEEVQKLMKRLNLEWEDIGIVPNYKGEFTDILKIYMYPSNIIVDKNMIVKAVNVGGNTRKLLRTLEQLSGEK